MLKYKEIIDKLTPRQKADLLTGRDFWSTLNIDELGIPAAYLSDGPHGLRKQAAASDHLGLNVSIPATCFPTAATMANSWNPKLGEEIGKMLGEEARSMRVNMLLGPGMNIKRNPLCGRDFEYFAEDPYLAGKMAAAYVRGIQSEGIYACVKHFACNNQEYRRMSVNSDVDERTLREIYLTGFEIAVKEGHTKGIMSSYNRLNGDYANENTHLLKDILRDEWGFDGVIVSDWAGCNDRVEGVIAGNELEMPACKYGADDVYKAMTEGWKDPYPEKDSVENYPEIVRGIKDGKLDMEIVDECIDRLLTFVFDTDKAIKDTPTTFDVDAHHAYAKKAAEETVVMLKNDGILPLKQEKVCFIGDFAENIRYQGAGSSVVNPTKIDKFTEKVKDSGLNYVGYAQGYNRYGKKKEGLAKKALKLAENADVIVFFAGLDEVTEAEGLDRSGIKLPLNQMDLFQRLRMTGKKIITILFAGSMVELDAMNDSDALLDAYLGGQAGVGAVLDILSGKVNPSGKLSETFLKKYEDCVTAPYFPARLSTQYKEGIYVGYRYYTTAGKEVAYPFGYGLSYSKFTYSDLKVTKDGVTFTITNDSDYDGAEVSELYVGMKDSKIFRPARELKGFDKTFIKAHEKAEISISFDDKTFRVYNPKKKRWETEKGTYEIMIGASVMDIRLEDSVEMDGEIPDFGYESENYKPYFDCKVDSVTDEQFETLLGRPPVETEYVFYTKKRMTIHENSTVEDLRYAPGWVGRVFSALIRFAIWFLKGVGNRTTSNTLVMGVLHQPVRGLAKFGGMDRRKMEGLLMMFNGRFFTGLGHFLSKEKKKKEVKE